jgi:hypothetical protein
MLSFMMSASPETVPLPGELAGPLHYPAPPSCAWLVVWFLLVAGLVIWLGRLLWRRLASYLESRPSPPKRRLARKPVPFGINTAIAKILRRHLKAGTFRQGCHELSEALKIYWEDRGLDHSPGVRFTRMTAREIEGRVGDQPASRLITLLSQLQFGRREPSRDDLQGACDLATDLVAKRGKR